MTFLHKHAPFFTSLSLFVLSFAVIRLVLYVTKLSVAAIYGIATAKKYLLCWGVSPAHSTVWYKTSVLNFYSTELVVLLIFLILSFIIYLEISNKKELPKFAAFWFFTTALCTSGSLVISGVITRTNVFHFFNWMYIPYAVMLVIALGMAGGVVLFGSVYTHVYLRAGAAYLQLGEIPRKQVTKAYVYTGVLPVMTGLFLLYIPCLARPSLYCLADVAVFGLFIASGALFAPAPETLRRKNEAHIEIQPGLFVLAGLSYAGFVIFCLVKF